MKKEKIEVTIECKPFSWNDNFSQDAQETFDSIREKLNYNECMTLGMALAKLKLLEKQGAKVW